MSGVFEALVVSGLFLLIAVVAVATVVLARRSRHNSAGYQARGVPSTTSTLPTGPSVTSNSQFADRSFRRRVDCGTARILSGGGRGASRQG